MNATTRDYRRHGFPRKTTATRFSNWLLATALLVVLFSIWSGRSKDEEQERAAAVQDTRAAPSHTLLQIDLDDCPPAGPGTTDLVLFAITTSADGKHRFEGCSRIAERPYIARNGNR